MWLGDAADRCRIGYPPGAPRERGCPPWVVLASRLWRRAASVLRDAGVAICWRGTAAGMHGRDCDRLADF